MPRSIKVPDAGSTYTNVQQFAQGGHGKTTAAEALVALNGIPTSMIDQALGPIPLLADGTLDPACFDGLSFLDAAVDGELTIQRLESKDYFLTTYDSYVPYVVEGIAGVATINRNTIRYTAGDTPGIGGFTINGRVIPITITGSVVVRPVVESPVNRAVLSTLSVDAVASAFSTLGDPDTHLNSDWELSTDVNFITLVASSYNDVVNLTTWSVAEMKELTRHYLRTRQRGQLNGVSPWSPVNAFTSGSNGQLNEWGKLTADDEVAGDGFGRSIALNADASIALICAMFDDDKGTDSGSVYVFTRTGNTWTQQQKLTASDGVAYDGFGVSVALNADASLALIGAHCDDDKGADSGSVYVFTRSGTVWTQQQKLTASDGAVLDYFGFAVALSADASIALISALYDDDKATDAGSVYVFTRVGSVWTQQQKLTASDGSAYDGFGTDVALSSDASIALVGAYCDDDKGNNSGSAYIFTRSGAVWTQQQKLLASDGVAGDLFGVSVALSADASIALIGTRGDDDKAVDAGSVYIFTRVGNTWTQQQKLTASDGAANDWFGSSVAVNSDATIVMVGALNDNDKGANSGSVYFFQ